MTITYFFDLDGTLCDSRPGLVISLAAAFSAIGYHPENLDEFLGPSLRVAFMSVDPMITEQKIQKGFKAFRAVYEGEPIKMTPVYPGVGQLLKSISYRGGRAWIVTSKPRRYADIVVKNSAILRENIEGIVGASDSETENKAQLLGQAMILSGASAQNSLMLGDREDDIIGALANGVLPVGALWGYGNKAELIASGCSDFCSSVDEFRQIYVEGTCFLNGDYDQSRKLAIA